MPWDAVGSALINAENLALESGSLQEVCRKFAETFSVKIHFLQIRLGLAFVIYYLIIPITGFQSHFELQTLSGKQ